MDTCLTTLTAIKSGGNVTANEKDCSWFSGVLLVIGFPCYFKPAVGIMCDRADA